MQGKILVAPDTFPVRTEERRGIGHSPDAGLQVELGKVQPATLVALGGVWNPS